MIYDRHASRLESASKFLNLMQLTVLEVIYAASFVVNFVLGKLLHLFSQEEEVYNYYNNKGNIFNQWFVKRGWGWTTVVIAIFYAIEYYKKQKIRWSYVAIRYIVATAWWIAFTQWCFGLPIMDKVFVLTGGKCANISSDRLPGQIALFLQNGDVFESNSITSFACRKLKGSWEGGHDPLGHVFLLVHSSLYLFHEIKPFWPGWNGLWLHLQRFRQSESKLIGLRDLLIGLPLLIVVQLLSLWWFMLLVTNMYFHSLAEKLVGLTFGYFAVAAVYYVPRYARGVERVKRDD